MCKMLHFFTLSKHIHNTVDILWCQLIVVGNLHTLACMQARLARGVEHRILPEGAAEYPSETLSAEENVTNRLAEAFYRDHGVRQIERGLDLAATTAGHRVMRSAYCIRREIGECLKERPRLKGDLWLERGANRYRLEFDCVRCEMSLVDCTRKETAKPKP